jgi:anti-anti-sigma factor
MAGQNAESPASPAVAVELVQPGLACVRLRGEHDLSTKPRLTEALAKAAAQINVVVDLTECGFIDSSVIAAFFQAGREVGQVGGRLELVIAATGEVRRAAELTALGTVLPVRETMAEALAGFGPQEHVIQIRDLRSRFGDDETRAAECTCGWHGPVHTGHQTAAREARREGMVHVERQRAADAAR